MKLEVTLDDHFSLGKVEVLYAKNGCLEDRIKDLGKRSKKK